MGPAGEPVAVPVVVKLKKYVPSGKLADVKAIVPFVPEQVVGLVAVPTVKTGKAKSVKVTGVANEPVQPLPFVMEKLLKVPSAKPKSVKAPEVIVTFFGLPTPE
ncbi:MAG: hypothetical protein EAZ32_11620 [Cytophagia bacterium]|nr:MAG: hypothetical protein EAZ46_06230 [Runella sp.]TAG19454.1 MAG: hypothetical protein EAZ38_12355 [Cytophagales bacterium]TAG38735.1 MAG: hypothetical protein EAZ32_11620 [Cytophagia bacterium]TAG80302.1 MAG: hypothetical protein EAZ22_09700 [Cytophagales bacterium]